MTDFNRKQGAPVLLAVVSVVLIAPSAQAASATHETMIPFADLGGIADWKSDGERGLYIQARNHKWYYASFMGPCVGVQFRERVGFVTEPGGELDKFSSVIVGDQRCYFSNFTESAAPGS